MKEKKKTLNKQTKQNHTLKEVHEICIEMAA